MFDLLFYFLVVLAFILIRINDKKIAATFYLILESIGAEFVKDKASGEVFRFRYCGYTFSYGNMNIAVGGHTYLNLILKTNGRQFRFQNVKDQDAREFVLLGGYLAKEFDAKNVSAQEMQNTLNDLVSFARLIDGEIRKCPRCFQEMQITRGQLRCAVCNKVYGYTLNESLRLAAMMSFAIVGTVFLVVAIEEFNADFKIVFVGCVALLCAAFLGVSFFFKAQFSREQFQCFFRRIFSANRNK